MVRGTLNFALHHQHLSRTPQHIPWGWELWTIPKQIAPKLNKAWCQKPVGLATKGRGVCCCISPCRTAGLLSYSHMPAEERWQPNMWQPEVCSSCGMGPSCRDCDRKWIHNTPQQRKNTGWHYEHTARAGQCINIISISSHRTQFRPSWLRICIFMWRGNWVKICV